MMAGYEVSILYADGLVLLNYWIELLKLLNGWVLSMDAHVIYLSIMVNVQQE